MPGVCSSVCLSVCCQLYMKTTQQIFVKFLANVNVVVRPSVVCL